jgi:exodeoxyribonuclease VIII
MPELIPGITNEYYHASPAIGSSRLKQVLKCPALYHANVPMKASAAMDLGTVVHAMVLEPDEDVAVIAPAFSGKGSMAARAEFKANNAGRIVMTAAEMAKAQAMASNVLALPDVGDILSVAQCEHSGWYEDPETGLACKYRPDCRVPWACLDLKSAADASPAGFSRAIETFGYHISAAHYLIGEHEVSGVDHETFCFLVVENTAPYLAASYVLDAESLALGRWQRAKALAMIKACTEANDWPSYGNSQVSYIGVPHWSPAMREFNEGSM